jgi:hypothetical protein
MEKTQGIEGSSRDKNGRFKPGVPRVKTAGRKKGTQNKFPADMRKIFEDVFEKIGGVPAFAAWAKKTDHNKGMFYQMTSKLLPRIIEGKFGGNITVIVRTAIPRPPKKAKPKATGKKGATK